MRGHVFSLSANTSLLRQALPVLVQPYKSILSRTPPNPMLLLRSSAISHVLVSNSALPKHHRLFSTSSLRKFTTRATHVNDAGSIDLPLMQSMEKKVYFRFLILFTSKGII